MREQHGRREVALVAVVTLLHLGQVRTGRTDYSPSVAAGLLGVVLAPVQGVALWWRRSRPELVFAVTALGFLAQAALVVAVPPYAAGVALYSLAVRGRRSWPAVVGAAALASAGLLLATAHRSSFGSAGQLAALLALVGAAGLVVRERRASVVALSQQAAAEERLRIARDLHDVLGHTLTSIAVQSSTGRLALDADQPAIARDALAAIEGSSRGAMREIRSLLGLLRGEDTTLTAEILEQLVAEARRGDVDADIRLHGDPAALPVPLPSALYRLVQESLTNAVRHAAPARATVEIDIGADQVRVRVLDDGARTVPADGGPADGVPAHGLVGMGERVAHLGGRLDAGPRPDPPGWRVEAVLPLRSGATGQPESADQHGERG